MAETYFEDVAAFYDARYGDVGDEEFYRDLAVESDGPVLEAGVGTGRIYLDLLAAGVDADGFDVSASMLDRLRAKADDRGLDPDVWRADMTEFAVDRAYDLVICPFRAFAHLLTVEDQLAALDRFHDALAPGGRLVFNVFVPNFELICERYGEQQEERFEHDGEEIRMEYRQEIVDEVAQVVRERQRFYGPDGDLREETEYRLTFLPPREVELLARQSPFADRRVTDFEGRELESWEQEQVWRLERED